MTDHCPHCGGLAAVAETERQLVEILRHTYTDDGIVIWMNGRNRNLGGERPAALLASDPERVLEEARRVAG